MNSMAGVLKSIGSCSFLGQNCARLFRKSNLKVLLQSDLRQLQPQLTYFHHQHKEQELCPSSFAFAVPATPGPAVLTQFSQSKLIKTNLNYAEGKPQTNPNNASSSPGPNDKPNPDQLQYIYNKLQESLERTFTHAMDYTIYHPEIVFIDNIRHLRTQGLTKYIQQVALLKTVGHIKFAYVKFEIINMNMSQEEGRITVRWRIKGLSGLRVMLKFWKYKLWKWQELKKQHETWHDGISYFDVGGDGKIFQHIADKVMEDKNTEMNEKSRRDNVPLAAKLGSLAAVRVRKY